MPTITSSYCFLFFLFAKIGSSNDKLDKLGSRKANYVKEVG